MPHESLASLQTVGKMAALKTYEIAFGNRHIWSVYSRNYYKLYHVQSAGHGTQLKSS
jgi:hypothetical protein